MMMRYTSIGKATFAGLMGRSLTTTSLTLTVVQCSYRLICRLRRRYRRVILARSSAPTASLAMMGAVSECLATWSCVTTRQTDVESFLTET